MPRIEAMIHRQRLIESYQVCADWDHTVPCEHTQLQVLCYCLPLTLVGCPQHNEASAVTAVACMVARGKAGGRLHDEGTPGLWQPPAGR